MTEYAVIKLGCVVAGGIVFEAVIDPSITSISLAVIAAAVVIIPLWFKFRTDQMAARIKEHDVKIEQVIKTSDGMKDALVASTAKTSHLEGLIEGTEKAEAKASVIAVAQADGAARESHKIKADEKSPPA